MITLDQARAAIGGKVIYRAPYPNAPAEEGVITSVGHRYVFVRYGRQASSTSTDPADLEFAAPGSTL